MVHEALVATDVIERANAENSTSVWRGDSVTLFASMAEAESRLTVLECCGLRLVVIECRMIGYIQPRPATNSKR